MLDCILIKKFSLVASILGPLRLSTVGHYANVLLKRALKIPTVHMERNLIRGLLSQVFGEEWSVEGVPLFRCSIQIFINSVGPSLNE